MRQKPRIDTGHLFGPPQSLKDDNLEMMKKLCALFSLAALGGLSSCETDININDDWEDVTVIYGLLDPTADTNWVRVERGYLGPAPANQSFNESDSLYYDTLAVSLEAFEITGTNTTGNRVDSIFLTKDTKSRELEPGVFTTEGYRLYRTTTPLKDDLEYRLTVRKPGKDYTDARATTRLVGGYDPNVSTSFSFKTPRDFPTVIPKFDGDIKWWASSNAAIYEIDLYFFYTEYDRTTKKLEQKSFKMDYETLRGNAAMPTQQEVRSNLSLTNFYQQVAAHLDAAPPGKLRFFNEMRIDVWAGGENLANYIALNEPSTGINPSKPEFPQIENGTGLLSSRTKISLDGIVLRDEIERKYYLHPILCDRGFAVAEASDTCFCEPAAGTGSTQKECF